MDDEGKDVRGQKLISLLLEGLRSPAIDKALKLRLLAIYIAAQRDVTAESKKLLIQAAKISPSDAQLLTNLERLSALSTRAGTTGAKGKDASSSSGSSSVFGSLFSKKPEVHAATPEGEYTDTRHVGQLKVYLEQMIGGELPADKFPSLGPPASSSGMETKSGQAKSVRKQHKSRWAKNDNSGVAGASTGARHVVFVAGGLAYSELRAAHDVSCQYGKEVVIGGSHVITPTDFLIEVADMENS